ncbi:MAG TPA: metal-dependent transcriptional regulator [Planctomycetota bacterium]|nr:metal-dependent transcriptional regulator [Planctomycetota bacterium]
MASAETISASLEDYLEAIFLSVQENGAARAKDIAARLSVTGASVTGALHALSERHLVNYAPYEFVTLTSEGEKLAQGVLRRHEALKTFLIRVLAVAEPNAEAAACAMEHALPRPILERLIRFVDFIESCPRVGTDLVRHFAEFCRDRQTRRDCEECIERCLERARRSDPGTE